MEIKSYNLSTIKFSELEEIVAISPRSAVIGRTPINILCLNSLIA